MTATITPKPITVTGITASDKAYDGTTLATLNTAAAALVGAVPGDQDRIVRTDGHPVGLAPGAESDSDSARGRRSAHSEGAIEGARRASRSAQRGAIEDPRQRRDPTRYNDPPRWVMRP